MSDMGTIQGFRQPLSPGQAVVAFDFDGTLTTHDSFTALLRRRAGPVGWALGLLALAPAAVGYVFDRDRGRIKAASMRHFLNGVTRAELEAEAEAFAAAVWDDFIRPDALACWKDWGAKGSHRVIVTASPALTVAPFARRLGAEGLIGTQMAFDSQERVTGAFTGANCRSEEKVCRLKAAYGEDMTLTAAYGDTSGDTEMLAMAQESGFRVFTARP